MKAHIRRGSMFWFVNPPGKTDYYGLPFVTFRQACDWASFLTWQEQQREG
jgi:hypothetical protein